MKTVVPTTAVSSPVREPVAQTARPKATRTANQTMESQGARLELHHSDSAAIAGNHIAAMAPNALPSSSVPAARPSPP